MLTIEQCIWIATGAFVILVIAIIVTMRMLIIQLNTIAATATDMKQDISRLSLEFRVLIQSTDETVKIISDSVQSVQGIVHATRQISASLEQTATMVENVTSKLSSRASHFIEQEKVDRQIDDAMQWADLAFSAWQLWQGGRKKSSEHDSYKKGHVQESPSSTIAE